MSYETFKTCLTDPEDSRYMDMERLMNTVYPQHKVYKIWPWSGHIYMLTHSTNRFPVEAYEEHFSEVES